MICVVVLLKTVCYFLSHIVHGRWPVILDVLVGSYSIYAIKFYILIFIEPHDNVVTTFNI